MRHIKPIIAAVAVMIAVSISVLFLTVGGAAAGTGPSGFASAAKAGINRQLVAAYGSLANSPWKVECSEKPNFQTLTDSVVCHITHK
jgi:hypothetical protein